MNGGIVVTALDARRTFGRLLRRVEDEGRSLVIEKRGSPRAVLLSIRDYVRLAVPEPEVFRIVGQESKQRGTNRLSARQIEQEEHQSHHYKGIPKRHSSPSHRLNGR